ncbi:hypothetical protein HID58_032704 [Brassica napus]|uniref:Replication factor A C-terminal domain-containing protein n=1 Tax=Brassica napus TaxID=3708 RepID=A0ABQ8BYC1_BRANA|nr:hypothetical protein HID58_032704 [Brassica napus]
MMFRLIHFWEARKNVKGGPGIILGIKMLMIDAEGTVAQGFIGQNRRTQYEKELRLGTEWYYIACKDCQTKLNRGPTTMLCPKCGNENATAVANYRVEMYVYDNEEQCTFIILGDAGKELTGRKATELIDAYVEDNGGDGAELEIPLPQCLIDTIGQTKKFRIKVAHYNFTSTRLSLTATKIFCHQRILPPLKTPPHSEVKIPDLPESSGGVSSASDEQKKAKRAKLSG